MNVAPPGERQLFFNGRVLRLESWRLERGTSCGTGKAGVRLFLLLRPTNWFTFAVTNMHLDCSISTGAGRLTVKEILGEAPLPLEGSKRANNLAVALHVVVRNGDGDILLLARRSGRNLNTPGVWSHAAGGDIDPRRDLAADGKSPDPFVTAARELEEELGISSSPSQIKVLALVLKPDQWQPVLLALLDAPFDMVKCLENRAGSVSGEVAEYYLLPLAREALTSFLTRENVSPNLAWEIKYVLAYKFGARVAREFFGKLD